MRDATLIDDDNAVVGIGLISSGLALDRLDGLAERRERAQVGRDFVVRLIVRT